MDWKDILLFVIAALNLGLGTVVLSRNRKSFSNITYSGVVVAAAAWAVGLAFFRSANDIGNALFWARFYYVAAAVIAYSFLLFGFFFPYQRIKMNVWRVTVLAIPLGLVLGLVYTDYHIENIFLQTWGKDVILGWSYVLYTVYFVMYVGYSFFELYRKNRETVGMKKLQIRYTLLGTLFAAVGGSLFNLFYPLFGNYQYIWLGPAFTLIMIGFIAYAISRYRLFDIRLVMVRSLVYVILSTIVALIFTALSIFFSTLFN